MKETDLMSLRVKSLNGFAIFPEPSLLWRYPGKARHLKCKLTAIASVEVSGYSRPMEQDELRTINTLKDSKQMIFSLIGQYQGRVMDPTGDNTLAEFSSVVNAVQCGVAVHNALKVHNAVQPDNRKMEFPIAINLAGIRGGAKDLWGGSKYRRET